MLAEKHVGYTEYISATGRFFPKLRRA